MTPPRTYHGIELPEQDNIDVALRLAREKLADLDPKEAAERLNCGYSEKGDHAELSYSFLGDPIIATLPEGTAVYEGGHPVPDFLLVLVLHYLIAEGSHLDQELITFVQVPSGNFYEEPFNRRTKKGLLAMFGEDVELFQAAAEKLGWEPYSTGDAGAVAYPFPKVPITFVLYGRDAEFPPDASILFDRSIPSFLPTEDIAMVSGLLVGKICKTAAGLQGEKK
jgi:hypothetical protein